MVLSKQGQRRRHDDPSFEVELRNKSAQWESWLAQIVTFVLELTVRRPRCVSEAHQRNIPGSQNDAAGGPCSNQGEVITHRRFRVFSYLFSFTFFQGLESGAVVIPWVHDCALSFVRHARLMTIFLTSRVTFILGHSTTYYL